MKRILKLLIIVVITSICLIFLGVQWRLMEIDKLKQMNYRSHSQRVMRHNTLDPQGKIIETKEIMRENYMHFIEEYETENSGYEIIGQSGKLWLFSAYLHKINFTSELAKQPDSTETPIWQLLVYAGDIKSGSMAYFTILCVCLMAIVGFSIKKVNLPHIFPEAREKTNINKHQNDSN